MSETQPAQPQILQRMAACDGAATNDVSGNEGRPVFIAELALRAGFHSVLVQSVDVVAVWQSRRRQTAGTIV